jgi:hypothetical protein
MSLRVGQKVVCIVDRATLLLGTWWGRLPLLPALGAVYEIAELREGDGKLWLTILELDARVWFWAAAFRPAVFGEREMEALQALLDDLPKPAPQRLLVDMLAEAEQLSSGHRSPSSGVRQ